MMTPSDGLMKKSLYSSPSDEEKFKPSWYKTQKIISVVQSSFAEKNHWNSFIPLCLFGNSLPGLCLPPSWTLISTSCTQELFSSYTQLKNTFIYLFLFFIEQDVRGETTSSPNLLFILDKTRKTNLFSSSSFFLKKKNLNDSRRYLSKTKSLKRIL